MLPCTPCGVMLRFAEAPRNPGSALVQVALFFLCLVGPTWLRAETISGTIQDSSGAVIAGAQIEMSLADEDRSSLNSVHRIQYRQRPFPKLKRSNVVIQGEVVEAIRLSECNIAELAIKGIRIRKRQGFSGDVDRHLLLCDGKRER